MVIQADDIGHSVVCNIGTFEAIRGGMISSADLMLDSPGTEDAVRELNAQFDRCRRILGKLPDTGGSGGNPQTPWSRAAAKVMADRKIVTGFAATEPLPDWYMKHLDEAQDLIVSLSSTSPNLQ